MIIEEPAPVVTVIDGCDGIGQVISEKATDIALEKARQHGLAAVTVKRSNHYGVAGYYALKAAQNRMIGISMTNSAPLVVPTFGADALLGTNPISLGAPAGKYPPFLLDMATSVIPRGKVEVYDRNRKEMPEGWTVDENGYDCRNPGKVLDNLLGRIGGGILPLGGRGETYGGHKGYGMSFIVDILCGVLSGAAFGSRVNDLKTDTPGSNRPTPDVGHFFLFMDIRRFMPPALFEERMEAIIEMIHGSETALDAEKIYFHGERSSAKAVIHEKTGIPIAENVFNTLLSMADELNVEPPVPITGRP